MNKAYTLICVILVLGVQDAKSSELSIFDAIREALGNNPSIDEAAARIDRAEAGIAESKSAWWPWLSTDLSYTRADAPSAYLFKTIDQHGYEPGTDFNNPGTVDDFELGVGINYSLYQGGRRSLTQRLAENGRDDAELSKAAIENELVDSVIRWYLRSLAAVELTQSAAKTLDTVQAELRDAKARFDAGAALKSDVLQLEVRLAEAKQDLISTQNRHTMSMERLANLLGRDGTSELALSGERWSPREIPETVEEAIPSAYASRPELSRARLAVKSGRLSEKREKRTFLPEANLALRAYGNDDDLGYGGDDVNWTIGAGVRWSIFEGGRRAARVRAANAFVQEMDAAARKAELEIRMDVIDAYVRLSDAQARLAVAKEALVSAEENLRLVKNQFEQGSATVTRYLDAERDLTGARVREIAARYECDEAHANIGRALGWCHECAAAASESMGGENR